MDDIDHKIESLIQGILGYSEKKLRASSLIEKFRGLALDEVAAILNQICIGAITRDLKYLKAYSVLPEFIDSLFDSPHELSQLRRIAREKNFPEVMQLFLDLPPKRMPVEDLESPEDPALKDLPIGHRKSLAKTQNLMAS